jgi:cytochrome P450
MADGVTIPAGVKMAAPRWFLNHDPELYTLPDTFDPLRFCDDIPKPDGSNKRSLAHTESTHLAFGYGRLACPGRFWAAQMMKLIFATLLVEYDFCYPEGQTTMPPKLLKEDFNVPDTVQHILLRKRVD